jgi:hypothetical protein
MCKSLARGPRRGRAVQVQVDSRAAHPRLAPDFHRAWRQRLKLQYDETLSNVAFNFSVRRYVGKESAGFPYHGTCVTVDHGWAVQLEPS